jgi:hypothetical protein
MQSQVLSGGWVDRQMKAQYIYNVIQSVLIRLFLHHFHHNSEINEGLKGITGLFYSTNKLIWLY